jgi:hypothetical protein
MAGTRISQLPLATNVVAADVFPFSSISGSQTRRITAQIMGVALSLIGNGVGATAPTTPSNGQLWIDTSTNPPVVKVYNGATWTIVSFLPGSSVATSPAGTAPSSPALGQLWQDTSQTPDQLKMYDGSNWVRVDPQGITQTAADARYLQPATAASTYLALAGGSLTGNLTLVGSPSTTNMAANKGYVDSQIAAIPAVETVPSGTIIWTARSTAPTGYLAADGSAISRSTYATLFSAIGTNFGAGNGSTTFNVPDLRGEFIRGWDNGRGVDSGRSFATAQSDEFRSHSHTYTNYNGTEKTGSGGQLAVNYYSGGTFGTSGAGGAETRPRNIAMLGCIKT